MSYAELQLDVLIQTHELPIGREVVAANDTLKFLSQCLDQHFAAATGRDLEDRKQIGAKAPRPQLLAVVFVPRLVDVQMTLIGQGSQQLVVRVRQALTNLAEELLNHSSAEPYSDYITTILLDVADRHVTDAFEPTDQGGHARTDQARLSDILRNRTLMRLATLYTGLTYGLMFFNDDRLLDQFDLLMFLAISVIVSQLAAATRALVVAILEDPVDLFVEK